MHSLPTGRRSIASLPPELIEEGCRRLGILALIDAGVYTITAFLVPHPEELEQFVSARTVNVLGLLFIGTSIAVYLVLRRGAVWEAGPSSGSRLAFTSTARLVSRSAS